MQHTDKNEPKWFFKVVYLLFIILVACSSLSINIRANAATSDDALKTVINFLNAQKNCNIDEMLNSSIYYRQIVNTRELYKKTCSEIPMKEANITKLSVVNDSLALVSYESIHNDMLFIKTSPVFKQNGKWKIVTGIPGNGYISTLTTRNKNNQIAEVKKAISDYSSSIREHDLSKMKKYIKTLPDTNNNKLEKHLKALSEGPSPEITTLGVEIISDALAIVQIETKYKHPRFIQNLTMCKENGEWKIVFGHPLVNTVIPRDDKTIEIK